MELTGTDFFSIIGSTSLLRFTFIFYQFVSFFFLKMQSKWYYHSCVFFSKRNTILLLLHVSLFIGPYISVIVFMWCLKWLSSVWLNVWVIYYFRMTYIPSIFIFIVTFRYKNVDLTVVSFHRTCFMFYYIIYNNILFELLASILFSQKFLT